jgi:hypothetical protein
LLKAMSGDVLAPPAHFELLRNNLAEHYKRPEYLQCCSMGDLVRENLETIRRNLSMPQGAARPYEVE